MRQGTPTATALWKWCLQSVLAEKLHLGSAVRACHCRLGRPNSAAEVYEEAQSRGIWTKADIVSLNMALDALSDSAQAAFAKCAAPLLTIPMQCHDDVVCL